MIYINGRFLEQSITGVQRFASELVLALAQIRFDLTIIVPNKSKVLNQSFLHGLRVEEVIGGTGHYWEQVTLPKYLKKIGSPLLLNLCNSAPIFYKNKISTHHDITYVKFPESYSWKFRWFYKTLTPLFLNNSHLVITVSDFSKKDISEFYNIPLEKIIVIYNAVSPSFQLKNIQHGFEAKEKFALAVSSPNYHKNFARMIEAYSQANVSYKIKIIGSASGVFSTTSDNQHTTQIDQTKIEFAGRVTDEQLIQLYQDAEFFIFPSLYEGFGIPPLEAQSCGCPVISSNAASLPEVLKESVLYFDPLNVADIQKAVEKIVDDVNLKEQLIKKGFENVKRFSWKNSAQQLSEKLRQYE